MAGEARHARRGACPTLTAALTPVSDCAGAGLRRGWCRRHGGRRRGGRRARGRAGASRPDRDVGGPAAEVPLRREDLVVERAHVQARRLPRVEVVRGRDGAARAVRLTHGPVLVERCGALDGRLVHARLLVDVVGGAVGDDGALERAAGRRVVRAERLGDVVLDERVRGPAVDG